MKTVPYIVIFSIVFLTCYMLFCPEHRTALGEAVYEETSPIRSNFYPEPKWKKHARIREVSDPLLGVILGDLESHLSNGHHYTDKNKLTWAHQVSHGINARIRNDSSTQDGFNGFYVLQDRSILIKEPEISIRDVSLAIPLSLRGPSFSLYMDEQISIWNERSLYLIDEWVSFTNGADAGRELNITGWQYELLQAHNFNIYCMCLAMVVQRDCSDYRDADLREFIMWNVERVFRLTYQSDKMKEEYCEKNGGIVSNWHICPHPLAPSNFSKDLQEIKNYIKKVQTSADAEELRNFARKYFGSDWCFKNYGF